MPIHVDRVPRAGAMPRHRPRSDHGAPVPSRPGTPAWPVEILSPGEIGRLQSLAGNEATVQLLWDATARESLRPRRQVAEDPGQRVVEVQDRPAAPISEPAVEATVSCIPRTQARYLQRHPGSENLKGDHDASAHASREDQDAHHRAAEPATNVRSARRRRRKHGAPNTSAPGSLLPPPSGSLAPYGGLPSEIWAHIMDQGLSWKDIARLRAVSRLLLELADDQGVYNEMWYGQHSAALNTLTAQGTTARRKADAASYQEGPCAERTSALLSALEIYGLKSECMIGVLLGAGGTYYVTLSGSKRSEVAKDKLPALERACPEVFKGQPYQIVKAGKVGQIEEAGEDKEPLLDTKNVYDFANKTLSKIYERMEEGGEKPQAPPGTCALPLLLSLCSLAGDAPRFMSERRYDPSRRHAVKVLGPSGEVEEYGHGETTPSCLHCRVLTSDQLGGARDRERRLRRDEIDRPTWEREKREEEEDKRNREEIVRKEQAGVEASKKAFVEKASLAGYVSECQEDLDSVSRALSDKKLKASAELKAMKGEVLFRAVADYLCEGSHEEARDLLKKSTGTDIARLLKGKDV